MPNKRDNNRMVYYDWNEFGYSVEVVDINEGKELDTYHAGNNRCSSADSDSVPYGTKNAVPMKTLRLYAMKEANRMRKEYGAFAIERDTKLRNYKDEED